MGFGQDYKKYGVKGFYSTVKNYKNPHEPYIKNLVESFANPSLTYLDLAAGDGVVTKYLIENGCDKIEGLEPFIPHQYWTNTKKPCSILNFHDIALGKYKKKFDVIVCSYALHLLEESFLPLFLYQLSEISSRLIILTPHKKPHIKSFWRLEKEIKFEKTKLKEYRKI